MTSFFHSLSEHTYRKEHRDKEADSRTDDFAVAWILVASGEKRLDKVMGGPYIVGEELTFRIGCRRRGGGDSLTS